MERSLPGQPVGTALPGWRPPPRPVGEVLAGLHCRLEPLDPDRHGPSLYRENQRDTEGRMWTYLPYGPFGGWEEYRAWLGGMAGRADPLFHAVIEPRSGEAHGLAAFLRIDPAHGCIEIGHLAWAPALQRTAAATEAIHLMLRHVFALGYRRCEWKCDSLNQPSRRAAERFGFTHEGVFRQAAVVKGRNRDTAWYSILDREWPGLNRAFEAWLAPSNFDAAGRQRTGLEALRRAG